MMVVSLGILNIEDMTTMTISVPGFELPQDIAAEVANEQAREQAQRAIEERTKSIIDSMAFDVYSTMVGVASGKAKPIPHKELANKAFTAVEEFVKAAGMRNG